MDKRLIGYARVSTEDQTTNQQVDALHSAGCDTIFVDDPISGSTTSRPELDKCLAELRPGDTLVVWKLDRLGRSTSHLLSVVEDLSRREVGFKSLTEVVDTTTSTGRLVLGVLASLAQFERDLIRERTAAALQAKKRRGERLGRPVRMTPSQVTEAIEMLEAGKSPSYVARLFRVDRSTLYRAVSKIRSVAAFDAMASTHLEDPAYPERLEAYGQAAREVDRTVPTSDYLDLTKP